MMKQYTKQDILGSTLLEKKPFKKYVQPLVWLSRKSLEEALMQGTIRVSMPDKKKRLFNVFKSNGFPYNKKIRIRKQQKIYWYFKEITGKDRYDRRHQELVSLTGVALAGDVEHIGLGKIVALRYTNAITGGKEIKLGVLADRGSAFSNNLYQLDLFEGIFDTRAEFDKAIRHYPKTVEAYILKKKGVS